MKTNIFLEKNETKLNYIVLLLLQLKKYFRFNVKKTRHRKHVIKINVEKKATGYVIVNL